LIFGFGLFGLPADGAFVVSIAIGLIILAVSLFGGALWLGTELRGNFRRAQHEAAGR
jgi:hypothetical protein